MRMILLSLSLFATLAWARSKWGDMEGDSLKDLCSKTPPTLWCANLTLAQACGWDQQCLAYKKAVYNKPLQLTLLYESLCPGCQNFIATELDKIYKQFPRSVLEIELIPYGNAKLSKDGEITCQHGPDECKANKFEGCVIDSMQDITVYFPFLQCIEAHLGKRESLEDAEDACFKKHKVEDEMQRMIQSCLVSSLGAKLQLAYAERTANVLPESHLAVPWLVFNNVSLVSAQDLMGNLPMFICQWYKGDHTPVACSEMKSNLIREQKAKNCWRYDF